MDGHMVAGLAVVEPAGPGADAQADQHGVVGEVHGVVLPVWRCHWVRAAAQRMKAGERCRSGSRRMQEPTRNSPISRRRRCGIGDDGAEIDVVGHAVERAAERDQRAGVLRHHGVLGIVDDGTGMGQLAPDLEEGGKLDRGGLAHGAAEERALDGIGSRPFRGVAGCGRRQLPRPRTGKRPLSRDCGIELVQQVGPAVCTKKSTSGTIPFAAPQAQPVLAALTRISR